MTLLLLDIKMPGMSGIDLYKQIEEIDPALPDKVVFITVILSVQKQVFP